MTVQLAPKEWTRDEYYRLADLGFFEHQRVELIHGEILRLSPQKKPHALTIGRLTTVLVPAYLNSHVVRVQCPLDLGTASQPEPDLAVVKVELVEAAELHPGTADLVIEVSRSSVTWDRDTKGPLYARAEIPVYWLFNLKDTTLEAYTEPVQLDADQWGYKARTLYRSNETVLLPSTSQRLDLSTIFR